MKFSSGFVFLPLPTFFIIASKIVIEALPAAKNNINLWTPLPGAPLTCCTVARQLVSRPISVAMLITNWSWLIPVPRHVTGAQECASLPALRDDIKQPSISSVTQNATRARKYQISQEMYSQVEFQQGTLRDSYDWLVLMVCCWYCYTCSVSAVDKQ